MKKDANYIKNILIRKWFNDRRESFENGEFLLGSEVRYGLNQRQADLIAIVNEEVDKNVIAVEIKSELDQINKKTKEQLLDYLKVFPHVHLVVAKNKVNKALKLIRSDENLQSVNLLEFDENSKNGVSPIIFKFKSSKMLDNKEILWSIPSNFLKKHFGIKGRKSTNEIKKEVYDNFGNFEIEESLLEFLKQKLKSRNERLLKCDFDSDELYKVIQKD